MVGAHRLHQNHSDLNDMPKLYYRPSLVATIADISVQSFGPLDIFMR